MKATDAVKAAFLLPFKILAYGARVTITGWFANQRSGARFEKSATIKRWLHPRNTGLLLDGQSARLSETESFQNLCLIARIGAGKTSRYIIPNVLDRAGQDCSVVVNDPKGEVFAATSGAMQRAGFKIIVINPENPAQSSRFNPLLEATNDLELEQLAEIIIRCGNPNTGDAFWNNGATRVLSVLLKVLRNEAQSSQPGVYTMANAYRLLQNFGRLGQPLRVFMTRATSNPADPQDSTLHDEWTGCITGNPEGVQSFVLNALTALRAMSNQQLVWLTATSDIQLADLRRQRTIIYVITPPQHAQYYAFFTSVFFQSVFNAAMRQMPAAKDLPLYVLFDEFGHSTIPSFAAIANTIRAYKVSLSVVLQSVAQLSARYGRDMSHAIQGGFNTIQTYSGSDPETCTFFERLCGKVRERQRRDLMNPNPQDQYREFNLVNADEVRTLGADETIVISTNKPPARLKTVGYFANRRFTRMTNRPPVTIPQRPVVMAGVPVVRI
jgi:type IV secretion system protein VirD4